MTQYRSNLRRSRYAQRSKRSTVLSLPFSLFKVCIFLLAIAAAIWFGYCQLVQHKLRDLVHEKISEGLSPFGLVANLGQASFKEGQGIQLNDLDIQFAAAGVSNERRSQVQVYEAFLHVPASMVELVSSELTVNALEFKRARITLARDSNGNWDFQPLIELIQQEQDSNRAEPIPVSFTDSEIVIIDKSRPHLHPLRLSNVNFFVQSIIHDRKPLLQIRGNVGSDIISNVEFTTYLDQKSRRWQTTVAATQARISKDILALLPASISQQFRDLKSVAGQVDFTARAVGTTAFDQIPSFELSGSITKLAIDDFRLPVAVHETSGQFFFSDRGFSVTNLVGKIGEGSFHCNYQQTGLFQREQWATDGKFVGFDFDNGPRISRWLPAYCQKFCREYSPVGISDIQFNLSHDGNKLSRRIIGDLTDVAFTYVKLPYKAENCSGKVTIVDGNCDFDVRSQKSGQAIGFVGFIRNLGKSPTFQIDISVPGELPIDQKMLTAIDAHPKMAKVLRAFNARGRVGGIGRIERQIPNGKTQKSFDIRLKRCSILHNSFDYPIHNIEGLVQVRDDQYTFSNLMGNNSSGKVSCNGTWDPVNGLDVRFLCNSVPLDDQLKYALKPEIREIWDGFRPRGTLDFIRVDMTLPIGKTVDLNIQAIMKDDKEQADANYVSIYPVWFPYEIQHLAGTVNIGNNEVKLTNIKGKHQRTWIVCQGDGRYSDDAWSVRLKDMLVGSLKVDEDLLTALPAGLGSPVRQLQYKGLVNVTGEMTVAGRKHESPTIGLASYETTTNQNSFPINNTGYAPSPHTPESSTSMAWNVRFDMDQAKMLIGLPVENVFGSVTLVGQYDGKSAKSVGELNIDSLTMNGAQITRIKGPIWIDENRAAAGIFATPDSSSPGLAEPQRSLTGQMQKGNVNFDAQTTYGSDGKFYFQGTLADGCLATACREFAPRLTDIVGHSFAAVRMTGDYTGSHSYRGDGTIQLRDAKIYELPLFLSLLKILKVRQASRTAFDSSNIDFKIEGESIDFTRMEFIGDAVSLIGNGKMSMDRDIDLNFYSVMGRNRINIPLISDLYRAGSQKTLWINVNGTLDNPQTHRHVLPQLNDSLKQLFQPRDSRIDQWAKNQSAGTPNFNKPTFRR